MGCNVRRVSSLVDVHSPNTRTSTLPANPAAWPSSFLSATSSMVSEHPDPLCKPWSATSAQPASTQDLGHGVGYTESSSRSPENFQRSDAVPRRSRHQKIPPLSEVFPPLPRRNVETPSRSPPDSATLQKQNPRSDTDIYTAPWVRGDGSDRAGFCAYCSTWHRLKDSAYWVRARPPLPLSPPSFANADGNQYHIHYTHGISCATGHSFPPPVGIRISLSSSSNDWEVLCGHCGRWVSSGGGIVRCRTAYFRHAYRCRVTGGMRGTKSTGGGVRKSPGRVA